MVGLDGCTELLKSTSKCRLIFESNRIKRIREIFPVDQWRWVDTEQNPAYVFSRGVSPTQTSKANIWLKGPAFLLEDEEKWPPRKPMPNDDVLDDTTSVVNANASFNRTEDEKAPTFSGLKKGALGRIINRFSNLPRAVRTAGRLAPQIEESSS